MKILLATDAWEPQVNGVVTALRATVSKLHELGHDTLILSPDLFAGFSLPTERDIRFALANPKRLATLIRYFHPDAIHIATEGPVGAAARHYCLSHNLPFTTSYHTQFPHYLQMRLGIPSDWTYRYIKRFHSPSRTVMVTTDSLRRQLSKYGIVQTRLWPRGVDINQFRPMQGSNTGLERPIMLYVGRVAVEKNLEAFLELPLPGTKRIVGDGPAFNKLKNRYPEAHFDGRLQGEALSECYASADVFVFPSRTDTYGLVLLEALASGTPVAAYPVQGPMDVLNKATEAACLDEDLSRAIRGALRLSRKQARLFALKHSWTKSTKRFVELLSPIEP